MPKAATLLHDHPNFTDLIRQVAQAQHVASYLVEKDYWLMQSLWGLQQQGWTFQLKGGTSLSKGHQIIQRFSEDIDVTIDYRSLVADVPDLASLSNTQRKKLSDALKVALVKHVTEELVPALRQALAQALPAHEVTIEVSDDAEKLWLYYPSAVENTDAYLRPGVLLEFGGRNATLPQDTMTIVPDVAAHVPVLAFPKEREYFVELRLPLDPVGAPAVARVLSCSESTSWLL